MNLKLATENELQGLQGLEDFADKTGPLTDIIYLDDAEAAIYVAGNAVAICTEDGIWEKHVAGTTVIGSKVKTKEEVLWWLCNELSMCYQGGSYRSSLLAASGWNEVSHQP